MMKHSKLTIRMALAAVLLIASSGAVWAQKVRVEGVVTDAATGEAMPFVNVALMRPGDTVFLRGATTDVQGHFDIADADTGRYLLQATFVGYLPWTTPLRLQADATGMAIGMRRGATLDEVQVVAEKPLYAMDGEKNLYRTADDPSVQTGTASDALQNAPGVEVDAEGNITLRGVSSVEIWINDRPSHMNAEALKQYIKQLPANAIERIEVITNPSARYSTSGGVINIVTSQRVTRNELLCVGANVRSNPSVSPWVSYVWANEKVDLNFYLNADYTRHSWESDGSDLLLTPEGDTSRTSRFDNHGSNHSMGGYMGFNLNWNIDSMTHLAVWLGAYPYWTRQTNAMDYEQVERLPQWTDLSRADDAHSRNFWGGGYGGAWLEHRFDTTGRKMSVSLNGNLWASHRDDYLLRTYRDAALSPLDRHTVGSGSNLSSSAELNYVQPLRGGFEIEAGLSANRGRNLGLTLLEEKDGSGLYAADTLRSPEGRDLTTGLAGYLTAQKRWGGLTLKLGMRAEQTWLDSRWHYLGSPTDSVATLSCPALVPSIHLSYRTPSFHNFSLSYTRRYSAPDAEDINPLLLYDDYSYSTGNPALLTSYTHNVEAAWNKFFMQFGSVGVEAYFRSNTDEQGSTAGVAYSPYHGRWVNYMQDVNIGFSHTEGVQANVTYRPSAFFNLRLNASLFNYAYEYEGFSDSKVSYSLRVNLWCKLWQRLEVFANARYTSPRVGLYSLTVANKSIDLGCSSDFFDRRLSVFLNVNDIFGWSEWGENSTNPLYSTTGSTRYNSRFVSLGATLRFGKMELENRARQGASESNAPQM